MLLNVVSDAKGIPCAKYLIGPGALKAIFVRTAQASLSDKTLQSCSQPTRDHCFTEPHACLYEVFQNFLVRTVWPRRMPTRRYENLSCRQPFQLRSRSQRKCEVPGCGIQFTQDDGIVKYLKHPVEITLRWAGRYQACGDTEFKRTGATPTRRNFIR